MCVIEGCEVYGGGGRCVPCIRRGVYPWWYAWKDAMKRDDGACDNG